MPRFLTSARTAMLTLIAVAVSAAVQAQTDPLPWNAPERTPTFRALVNGKPYEDQARKVLPMPRGTPIELVDNAIPEIGSRIWWVDDSSRRRGQPFIESGDIIFKAGDEFAMLGPCFIHPRETRRIYYYSIREQRRRSMAVPADGLRFFGGLHWQPHITYLTTRALRNPRWDYDAVVGLSIFAANGDVAETALHRASLAGFKPTAMTLGVGAWIALRQGRHDAAADFAYAATKGRFAESKYTHPMVLYQTAIANYKMKVAQELVEAHEGYFGIQPGAMQRVVEMHTSRGRDERTVAPPSTLAESMYRDNLAPRLVTFPRKAWKNQLGEIKNGKPFNLNARTDQYALMNLGAQQAINNFDIRMTISGRPSDNREGAFERELMVAIRDLTATERDMLDSFYSPSLLSISFLQWPVAYLSHSNVYNDFGYVDPATQMDGKNRIKLRMVRVNGQAEIYVNGSRVLYCPVDESKRNVGLVIKSVGMNVKIESFKADELIEQP